MRRLLERENEKHESPLCTSTRESVCTLFSRDHEAKTKQSIISMFRHRWFVQSFKEVGAERGINRKSCATTDSSFRTSRPEIFFAGHLRMRLTLVSIGVNSNVLHTSRSWFIRTVEVTIQSPTTARMLRAQQPT